MPPRIGTRSTAVPRPRRQYVQRTPEELKQRVDELADKRGISTNTLINELLERAIEEDQLADAA